MRPIFLIGFMCSGKTTLGHAVARASGLDFVDLDQAIEEAAGMSVKDIFATAGEAAFRRLEHDMLKRYASATDVIVACGGGTPCQPGAMELMNECGTTIYLVPQAERLVHRLMSGRHKRPLIASINTEADMAAFAYDKLSAREPFYSKAQHRFDSSMLDTPFEISVTTDEFIKLFL